jgi:NADPH-dependent F420 reductase
MADTLPTVAILGGTGKEGSGLALRWAIAGYPVIVGSRDAGRAAEAASRIAEAARAPEREIGDELDRAEVARRLAHAAPGWPAVRGMANEDAAAACDIAVLTVPFAVQLPTLTEIRGALSGKILIDVTVPLVPPRVLRVQLPEGGSAVVKAQALLGDSVKVVAAFQNVSAAHLGEADHAVDCDVLVCGDDKAAREAAIRLAEAAGLRGWHAGPLANSAAAEALTSVLLFINRTYGIDGAGIRITGTPTRAPA